MGGDRRPEGAASDRRASLSVFTIQGILADKTRFLTSVAGIAFSCFLITLLVGLYQGWNLKMGRFVEEVDADLWLAREGVSDFLNSASLLPEETEAQIESTAGVTRADPTVVRPMKVETPSGRFPMHLIGYENGASGGPLRIKGGRALGGEGELVVDDVFAEKAGLKIGQSVEIAGERLEVVGTSSGGDFVFSQTGFTTLSTAQRVAGMPDLVTFYLLQVEPGADLVMLRGALESKIAGTSVFTGKEFAESTRERVVGSLLPVIGIIVFLCIVVGVTVTGLTVYNLISDRAREYGILKAVGFTNTALYRFVIEQVLAIGLAGFVLGLIAAVVLGGLIAGQVPAFPVTVRLQDVALVFGLTVMMSLLAALLPARHVASVDPVTALNL